MNHFYKKHSFVPNEQLIEKISRHTVAIFRRTSSGVKALGTGVLVKNEGRYYLVSAAHVLESEVLKDIIIHAGNGQFMGLGIINHVITSISESKTRKDDKLDFSLVEFQDTLLINMLNKNFDFLNYNQVLTNHTPIKNDLNYIILGYHGKKSQADYINDEVNLAIYVFSTRISEFESFEKIGCTKVNNIFLEYPKRWQHLNDQDKLKKMPIPYGISGCGLWYISEDSNKNLTYSLVGIMTESQLKYARVMIATKFKVVDSALRMTMG